jgi:hypothetical protein
VKRPIPDARACDIGVMKYPANQADASSDFNAFGAENTRMAIIRENVFSPNSTMPEKKQRALSHKNVLAATSDFEKLLNMRRKMEKIMALQAPMDPPLKISQKII